MTGDNRGRLLDHHRVTGRVLARVQQVVTISRILLFVLISFSGNAFSGIIGHTAEGYPIYSDQGDAVSACNSSLNSARSADKPYAFPYSCTQVFTYGYDPGTKLNLLYYRCRINLSSGWSCSSQGEFFTYPVGSSCSSRLDGQPGMINGTLTSSGVCNNGCKMKANLDPGTDFTLTDKANSNAIIIKRGTWVATGETCHDEPAQPPEKPEYCHTVQGGYTVCKSKDQTCVVTPSGFRTCASDAGNISGQVATNNQRTEAVGISAPNTPANGPSNRPGENWSQTGGQSITNNISNVVTNINNYSNSGTPNGNQPVKGDGSAAGGNVDTGTGGSNGTGSGSGNGSGDGNGKDYGSVTGGGSCDAGFACTGGDPVLCSIAQQQFTARCESESRFGGNASDFPGSGSGDGDDPEQEDVHKSHTFGLGMLDSSGFLGGGSCPDFGSVQVMGVSVDLDADGRFCQIVGVARACQRQWKLR